MKKAKRKHRPITTLKSQLATYKLFRPSLESLEQRWLPSGSATGNSLAQVPNFADNPMSFEANQGQTDSQVRFLARGNGYAVFLSSTEAVLSLTSPATTTSATGAAGTSAPLASAVFRFDVVNGNPAPAVTGVGELPGVSNYLRGNDPSKWISNVPNYSQVAYHDVYPGIDMTYHGNGQELEYDFTVAAGVDPSTIQLRFQGASGMSLDGSGNLLLHTAIGDVVEQAPVLYQVAGGSRQPVAGSYVLENNGQVGFRVGVYDPALPLVIDPVLAYSTYLGQNGTGSGNDPASSANGVAVDQDGNTYITGTTSTTQFPTTADSLQPGFNGNGYEAFVTKLNPAGQLVYSTYLGGNPDESGVHEETDGVNTEMVGWQFAFTSGNAIAVDGEGNVYVTGNTNYSPVGVNFWNGSIGFMPLVNAFQEDYLGGVSDGFVAKLNPAGSSLVYSSYVGQGDIVRGSGVAVDAAGNAYVVGSSELLPQANNGDILNDLSTAFVVKVDPNGNRVYEDDGFGGLDTFTSGNAIAIDNSSNVYFTGDTDDPTFAKNTPIQETLGSLNAYVQELDSEGNLVTSAKLGGPGSDGGNQAAIPPIDTAGIALHQQGKTETVYITGETTSPDFPTTENAFETTKPNANTLVPAAFVTELSSDLSQVIYSTYLGGSHGYDEEIIDGSSSNVIESTVGDIASAIAVDADGAAYVVGKTSSIDFPVVDAVQNQHSVVPPYDLLNPVNGLFSQAALYDAFVTKLDPSGSSLEFSTYLGGSYEDGATGVAVDSAGGVSVVGTTVSTDFPHTDGAVQESLSRVLDYQYYSDEDNSVSPDDSHSAAFVTRLAPPLRIVTQSVHAYLGEPFNGPVATFAAPIVGEQASDFSATINWGDGTIDDDAGIIRAVPGSESSFTVFGNHTYSFVGAFPIVVTVHDNTSNESATAAAPAAALGNQYQDEPTIVSDPSSGSTKLFIAGNSLESQDSGGLFTGTGNTTDQTWSVQDVNGENLPEGSGAKAAWGPDGNIYLLYETPDASPKLVLVRSNDDGESFEVVTDDFVNGPGQLTGYTIAAGPGPSGSGATVWVAWVLDENLFIDGADVNAQGDLGDEREFPVAPTGGLPSLGDIAVGPNGDVAVAFESLSSIDASVTIYTAAIPSTAQLQPGEMLAANIVASTNVGFKYSIPAATEGIDPDVQLAWDQSAPAGGSEPGILYMVYTDAAEAGSEATNIMFARSEDGGESWQDFQSVYDGPQTDPATQFLPSIAVDPTTGIVGVGWYDTRDSATGESTRFYVATYDPTSNTFSSNVPVNLLASNAESGDLDPLSAKLQYGDYTGLTFSDGLLHPAWTDNSLSTDNNPLPFQIATSTVAVADVTVPPPVVVGKPLSQSEDQTISQPVAKFFDPDSDLKAGDFSAQIDWGDGSEPVSGTISPVAGVAGVFAVTGSHLYETAGAYVVRVTVTDMVHHLTGSTINNVSQSPKYQGEGAVTVDPSAPSQLFTISQAENGFFAASSDDGGVTWNGRAVADGSDGLPVGVSNPKAVYDEFGNLFLSYVSLDGFAVDLAYSTDGGQTFQLLKFVSTSNEVAGATLAVGPGAGGAEGSVWVGYLDGNQKLSVFGATVSGLGQIGDVSDPQMVPGPITLADMSSPDLAVGPDGQVAVVYQTAIDPVLPSQVYINLDPNTLAQADFGPAVLVTSTNVGDDQAIPAQAVRHIDAEPRLAWDTQDDEHNGRLYLVYTDAATTENPETNIFVRYSDDIGQTWSDPVQVNDDDAGASHFLPSISIDPMTGDVAVGWYDTRNDPANVKSEFFASISSDGGDSFSSNTQVSEGPSDATAELLDDFAKNSQYGDNSGLAFFNGVLYPAWTDNSDELGRNPDLPQFDLAVGRMPTAQVADIPLDAQAISLAPNAFLKGFQAPLDLATFTDADPGARLSLYSTTIDWGDDTDPTSGDVRAGNGNFIVSAQHAYESEGDYTITVTIDDVGGASAEVTLDVHVDDGTLTPSGLSVLPALGVPFDGLVAHFMSSDPKASPKDFATTIDWGDGTETPGQLTYDGTAAFTYAPGYGLLAIGNRSDGTDPGTPYLISLSDSSLTHPGASVLPLLQLTQEFHGGLTSGPDLQLYAISSNDSGESYLNRINPYDAPNIEQLSYLGIGFTGGLAFNYNDGNFYAIAEQAGNATLYAIDSKTFAAEAVGSLGALSFTGLTFDSADNLFYAVANDAAGVSTLYRIKLGTTLEVTSVSVLGNGFTGGLAFIPQPVVYSVQGPPISLFSISGDGTGAATFNAIPLQGAVISVYEIGAQFNYGFDVVGTHTYSALQPWTIHVHIQDLGGNAVDTVSNAQVVDESPVALAPPPPFTAFQGFATGPVTLAEFMVPGGAAVTTDQFTATINWGDGSNPETTTIALTGGQLVVSSTSHIFTAAGTIQPTITLSDSGGPATVTDTIDVLPDVSKQTRVVGLGGPFNPQTGFFISSESVTDICPVTLKGPFYLIVEGLPAGVTLADADGTMFTGESYRIINISLLTPGQTTSVDLQFNNPDQAPFTYSVAVIDGPFGASTPVGATPSMGASGPGFVANDGQADPQVRFLSQGADYTLFLTATDATLALQSPAGAGASQAPSVLHLELAGASAAANPVGIDPLPGRTNYLMGNDPSQWLTGVASFARVEYPDVYAGITLDYHSSASARLEYDFTVAPGAHPSQIRLAFQGASNVTLDGAGNLILQTAAGDVVEQAPVLCQEINGACQAISGGYVTEADGEIGFRVGVYDPSRPLIIDPVLVYSTYLGGSQSDVGNGIATDPLGDVYVTGSTYSPDFPTLVGFGTPPIRLGSTSLLGGTVVFVTKYDPSGAMVYSTYFGGSGTLNALGGIIGDMGNGIAVDAAGEAVAVGKTYSADFPIVNALAQAVVGGASAFVSKLKADGSGFVFSTYLQGTFAGAGVALDPGGNIYVTGTSNLGATQADALPTTPGALSTVPSSSFIEKLSPKGDRVLYATYVPGTEPAAVAQTVFPSGGVNAIAVDQQGNVYVTGYILDPRFIDPSAPAPNGPVLHAAQPTFGGGEFDAFAAKLNASETALSYWTYLGGNDNDIGNSIAVDQNGNAYIAGTTMSADFPVLDAAQPTFGGIGLDAGDLTDLRDQGKVAGDAFAVKLGSDGSLVYSTYLGGSGPDTGTGIAVDAAGDAYVTGQTDSTDFPTAQALQSAFGGDSNPSSYPDAGPLGEGDAFVTRLNATSGAIDYSTYLGGSGTDGSNAIAVTPGGDAVVTGFTTSVPFPTLNAAQPENNNITSSVSFPISTAFVTKIASQGAGFLQVSNVPFQPIEGTQFTGVVAAFTDTDTSTATDYTATIDWGDGTTSAGVIASSSAHGFGFTVSGSHTYSEEGQYPIAVTVHDVDGSTSTATGSSSAQGAAGPVTYRVSVDTSALTGSAGFLDFQFNPGALPGSQTAQAAISQFQSPGGTLGSSSTSGNASGSLLGEVQLGNANMLNELKQAFTFGNTLTFDVQLSGDALSIPLNSSFGSVLSLTLLGPDGVTPVQTTAADGAVMKIGISPSGATQLLDSQSGSMVHSTVATTISVLDAPLQATLVPIQAVEGTPFSGTVAKFDDGNASAPIGDFTASVLWGDGMSATAGTIVADGGGRFHVTAGHTFTDAGNFSIRVVITDKGGTSVAAVTATGGTSGLPGLQAARVAFVGDPVAFASGDFNGDGKPDLVVWDFNKSTGMASLDVLLGNGDGSFTAPVTLATKTLTAVPPAIAIADLTGNGKLDIITDGLVFLGNGDGTFTAGPSFSTGNAPLVGIAVADFNGDGKPDLALVNGAGTGSVGAGVTILMGNGDGSFQSGVTYDANDPALSDGVSVVAPDFNGDGKPDLAVSIFSGSTSILLNNGDGTFGPVGQTISGVTVRAAADLRDDGKIDLIGTDGSQAVVVLGNGDGTFQNPVAYAAGPNPFDVLAADLDGDGKPDLAVLGNTQTAFAGGATISILKGKGDGTFAAPQTYYTNQDPSSSGSGAGQGLGLVAADFNGDGQPDIVFINSDTLSVLFNQGGGSLVDAIYSPSGGGAVQTLTVTDFNGDGKLDVVAQEDATVATLQVLTGQGDGTFQSGASIPVDPPGGFGLPFNDRGVLTADLNGDGRPDLVAAQANTNGTESVNVLLNQGNGTFQSTSYDLGGGKYAGIVAGDFTSDGKIDLVADLGFNPSDFVNQQAFLRGNGDGTFQAAKVTTVSSSGVGRLLAADVNGDGKLDLVKLERTGAGTIIEVDLGNGDGTFQAPIISGPLDGIDFANFAPGFAAADINGDGKLDLAIGTTIGSVAILLGNGDGTFAAPILSPAGGQVVDIVAGDLNGDGKTDLVVAHPDGTISELFGNGDGTFKAPMTYLADAAPSPGSFLPGSLGLGDFNGDGTPDVIVAGANRIAVVLNLPSMPGVQNVADAPLSATGLNHGAVQNATFFGSVARFTDGNPLATTKDFTATITWGDGQISTGTIAADSNGGFVVLGTHVYAQAATESISVAIADKDGSTATAQGTISVSTTPDAALTANGSSVNATAGVALTGIIANFTDGDPSGTANDFTATITWGDGQTSLGQLQANSSGGFEVTGTHSYAQAGTYQTTVTIVDTAGATASPTGSVNVAANTDPPLAAVGMTFQPTEQSTFSGIVATFTDADPAGSTGDYIAQINWGDGFVSTATISADAKVAGQFDVSGTHSYPEDGSYAVAVQISDKEGATAAASNTALVSDAALTASSNPVAATEGTAFSGMLVSFTDVNPFSSPGDFTATITWGDGNTSAGSIGADPSIPGLYEVTGTNTFARAGQYMVTVSITDEGGAVADARILASVADAPLIANGMAVQGTNGSPLSGVIATFMDQNSGSTAGDFLATIFWGDGQTTPGSVAPDPNGGFDVSGTHAYADSGTFVVRVSILDTGGETVLATGSAVVAGSTVQAQALAIEATEGTLYSGPVASFFASPSTFAPSDFAASIDWGNGQTSAGTVALDPSTGRFSVIGNMTYAEEGSYTVKVTIGDSERVAATLTSTAAVADAALTATPDPVAAFKGVPFSRTLARFTDADPAGLASDYTAQITWGDGQSSTGSISADPSVPGQFDVTGSVTYTATGSMPVSVTLTDMGGATAVVESLAAVTVLPLASGATFQAQATVPFSVQVATISDINPGDQPTDFTATIDWGDGHGSAGLVANDSTGFRVLGSSVYAHSGTYAVVVTLVRRDGTHLTASSTAQVSAVPDASLTRLPNSPITAQQDVPATTTVGAFKDSDPAAKPGDYTATIEWGDGSSSAGSIIGIPTFPGDFLVVGSHSFAKAQPSIVLTSVTDAEGASVNLSAAVQISPTSQFAITATGASLQTFERSAANDTVASFTDDNPAAQASYFTATINWGDGVTSPGAIQAGPSGFGVAGGHTYLEEGHFTITVHIAGSDGSSAIVTSSMMVLEELLPGGVRGTPNQRFVSELYRDMLSRQVDPLGLAYWSGLLDRGVSRFEIVFGIEGSIEYKTDVVEDMYHQFLHRDADPLGLKSFVGELLSGQTQEGVEAIILGSPEYFQTQARGTNAGFLDALYGDVFSRSVDPSGANTFGSQLAAGISRQQIADQILNSNEYRLDLVESIYSRYLVRDVDPSGLQTWTGLKATGASDEIVLAAILGEMRQQEYFDRTLP
jgi:hypothetical protein